MSLRLWIAAAHDPVHRHGGWAWVRAQAGAEAAGWAGGDRRTTHARTVLSGFLHALNALPPGPLALVAPRADALVLHTLLKPPADPPTEDLDLRAALATALAGRAWTLAVGDPTARTPTGFTAAWSETASGKARMGGAFQVAIPKVNLAKAPGL